MIPYLGNVLRGWTEPLTLTIETTSIVNFQKSTTSTVKIVNGNLQPMPAEQIERKPEEQWSWRFWSLIIKEKTPSMKTNDYFTEGNKRYRVNQITDWGRSGFVKYECIEDYQEAST